MADQPSSDRARKLSSVSARGTFEALGRYGRRGGRPPLRVMYLAGSGPTIEVAFAVPRGVGGAVERNRLRRRVRELLRDPARFVPPGSYLISLGPPAAELTYAQLGALLDAALQSVTAA